MNDRYGTPFFRKVKELSPTKNTPEGVLFNLLYGIRLGRYYSLSAMAAESSTPRTTIHPALTINNIKTHIPITLDLKDDEYSSWVFLFELHLEAHNLMFLINQDPAPSTIDVPTRKQLDALVRQWMFFTMSKDLMLTVLKSGKTSKDLWEHLKTLFQDNKGTRAATLESKFVNLKLTDCSDVDDYCDKLKAISDRLQDLEFPMDDKRLVIQLVNGLPPEYDTVASLISQTMSSFEAARSQLRTEEHQSSAGPPIALATPEPAVPAAFIAPSPNQAPTPSRQASPRFSNPTGGRRNRSNGRRPPGSAPVGTFASGR
ncbi:unnamed protein product [Cuscuta europaea]|uniref:Uncharacterized protein n=1 Tax=Cuscuta europaea TaxID=41803 RepID=A0A9P0ZVC0_CUSEU|nr:unnamed protein product [Cuscuta europaea]